MLDVAAGLVDAGELQRRTAEECHGFGLTLAEGARRGLAVGLPSFGGVAEQDVGELVEPRLGGERIDRVNGDHAVPGEAEAVAVDVIEQDLLDLKPLECLTSVPVRNLWCRNRIAVGLAQDEPARLTDEPGHDVAGLVGGGPHDSGDDSDPREGSDPGAEARGASIW